MRSLHLHDSPQHGGATVAARSVIDCLDPGYTYYLSPPPPSDLARAIRTIGGYCDPVAVRWLRHKLRLTVCDVVHLHSFKEIGTAAIKAAKLEGKRVVASIYDYNCLCPRDTGYGCCELRPDRSCWRTWQPVNRKPVPLLAKLPLIGRRRRIMRWLNELDAVVCLSRHSEGLLREHGLTVPVHVVPLPITIPALMSWQGYLGTGVVRQVRNPHVVLYLGGEHAHKGAAVFRKAMEIVQAQRPEVIGKMVNGANRHSALREIATAACLVVPELWPNPGPVVIVEAQLLGTPVVASGIGGILELEPTFYAPTGDPRAFARRILDVLNYGRLGFSSIEGMAMPEKDKAERRHDPIRICAQLKEIYRACPNARVVQAGHYYSS